MNDGKRSAYTIRSLLEELKEHFPKFENDQIFETLKSIYPDSEIPKEKKNIKLENVTFTKPLALSRKDKSNLIKEESKMVGFFKNLSRGDFLRVVEVEGNSARCINLSLNEDVAKKYYKDEVVTLTIEDVTNGTVKPYKRKINKYLK
jgi:hypothetical protein